MRVVATPPCRVAPARRHAVTVRAAPDSAARAPPPAAGKDKVRVWGVECVSMAQSGGRQPPRKKGRLDPPSQVAAALARASAAVAAAEHALDRVPLLPSARPRRPLPPALRAAARGIKAAAAVALLLLAAAHGAPPRAASAAAVAAAVGASGLRSRALSKSGAAAAVAVGAASLGASLRVGATVLAFFFRGHRPDAGGGHPQS